MHRWRRLFYALVLVSGAASIAQAQQPPESIPDQPFKTVHLMAVMPYQDAALRVAIRDFNREFAEQGCPACAYHLFKMFSGKDSQYTYIMTADWPSRDTYTKIHTSSDYEATSKRNPVMSELYDKEVYGRYVEVK